MYTRTRARAHPTHARTHAHCADALRRDTACTHSCSTRDNTKQGGQAQEGNMLPRSCRASASASRGAQWSGTAAWERNAHGRLSHRGSGLGEGAAGGGPLFQPPDVAVKAPGALHRPADPQTRRPVQVFLYNMVVYPPVYPPPPHTVQRGPPKGPAAGSYASSPSARPCSPGRNTMPHRPAAHLNPVAIRPPGRPAPPVLGPARQPCLS